MRGAVLCILALIAIACRPGLGQERTYLYSKQEEVSTEPSQGGTYVDPKQGGTYVGPEQGKVSTEPSEGGTYVDPKRKASSAELRENCGGKLTVDGSGTMITSPGYPNKYGNYERCEWTIKAQDPDDTLKLECSDFNLISTKICKGDRLVIYEGQNKTKLCGRGSKSYTAESNNIDIKFRTNGRRRASGFSCVVRSISAGNGETCSCGIANPTRIVGGQEVIPQNKYPWQVGIKEEGDKNYWCGGSIINNKYIMTAAHCVYDLKSTKDLLVGVADHNMYSTNDNVIGVTRLLVVKQVIVHPLFSSSTFNNDIALLKLKETLDLSQHKQLRAVCLPANDSKTYAGKIATASGWGTLSAGGKQPNKLREVSVPILPLSCWNKKGITERMLCSGLKEGGKDTCQGDSGGPLVVQESSKNVQIGITSWGIGCANSDSPGVYARVSKFLTFIKTNTADATYCQ